VDVILDFIIASDSLQAKATGFFIYVY